MRAAPLGPLLALAAGLALAAVACEETRGDYGDECLADDDCLSGLCVGRQCVSPPPVFTAADSGDR